MADAYQHVERDAQPIDTTGAICTLNPSYDTRTVSVYVAASEATDFAIEVKFAASDEWVQMDSFNGTDTVTEAFDLPAFAHRIVVTSAASADATADVKMGAV